jgi:L-iditol 2-dehydrogenase
MRAALLHAPGDLRVEDVPGHEPGPGEVVLRVWAALTCGTDVKTYRQGHASIGSYPSRLGHEFAGEVKALGAGVTGWAVGDRVFCANSAPCDECFQCARGRHSLCEDLLYLLGGFADEILVPARITSKNLHRLPPGLALDVAPMAEPLACAVHAVERAQIEAGDSAVILGGGSLGLMICALVRAAGCDPIVLDPHDERRARALRFGAAQTIRAVRGPADVAQVRGLTNGRGAGQVFEAVGRTESWELAIEMARPGGTVNLFGGCPAGTWVRLPTARPHYEEVRIQGSYHHSPRYVAEALSIMASGGVPWAQLCGPRIELEDLEAALSGGLGGSGGTKFSVLVGGPK